MAASHGELEGCIMKVCITPFRLLCYPDAGGHAWVYLNWALGLQANGCEVIWLEELPLDEEPLEVLRRLRSLRRHLSAAGLQAQLAIVLPEENRSRFEPVMQELERLAIPWEAAAEGAELALNFCYVLDQNILRRFKRTALVDIDPGLLQIWISQGQLNVAKHDLYFTIGETVGQPGARFPDCGLRWSYTAPPVFLPAWPSTPSDPSAPYTTVSIWWGIGGHGNWEVFRGEAFNNEKRTSFLDYLNLPSRTSASLELALCLSRKSAIDNQERRLLERSGWKVRYSWDVSSTLEQYRAYIQQSRGEFSCAKPSCMRFGSGWISDRSLCYLASGKPVVVQHTGPSRFLPEAQGMFRFRTLDEAVGALSAVELDYDRHSRLARTLAETYFDAKQVVGRILERAVTS